MSAPAEQRTEQWQLDRAGRLTASTFVDIVALTQAGKPTAARAKLMRQKAFERLAGIPRHEVGSKSLSWGQDLEQAALEAYEIETGAIVTSSGFLLHPKYAYIGASPDGLVGSVGGIEMKCPHEESVHVQTWLEGMPDEHIPQVQGNMLVTGRKWWDFISYDPRQGERFRLYIQRIPRDDAYCRDLLAKLVQFEIELKGMVKKLEQNAANQEAFLASMTGAQRAA